MGDRSAEFAIFLWRSGRQFTGESRANQALRISRGHMAFQQTISANVPIRQAGRVPSLHLSKLIRDDGMADPHFRSGLTGDENGPELYHLRAAVGHAAKIARKLSVNVFGRQREQWIS